MTHLLETSIQGEWADAALRTGRPTCQSCLHLLNPNAEPLGPRGRRNAVASQRPVEKINFACRGIIRGNCVERRRCRANPPAMRSTPVRIPCRRKHDYVVIALAKAFKVRGSLNAKEIDSIINDPVANGSRANHPPRSLLPRAGVAAKAKIVLIPTTCAQALKLGYAVFAALCRRFLLLPAHSQGRRTKRLPGTRELI